MKIATASYGVDDDENRSRSGSAPKCAPYFEPYPPFFATMSLHSVEWPD